MVPECDRYLDERPVHIPVGYDQAKNVVLAAPDAHLHNLKYKGGMGWANDWISGWQSTDGTAAWDIEVVANAEFDVILYYACPGLDIGSEIAVVINDKELRGKITQAHDPEPLPSPDRVKRKEVYEKVWGELEIGFLDLKKGRTQLMVKALTIPGQQAMELKAVRLTKKD